MIGSGFSRNAEKVRPSVAPPPLWRDLAQEMFNQLYSESESGERNGGAGALSTNNVLRLAQAYESYFGRSRLEDFLVKQIRDDDFNPGEMHSRLLSLPWRDVFTTNWDTLLERSNSSIGRSYDLVRNERQLPRTNPPRIVKLHGSLDGQFPPIVTEEDYRTYHEKHALFVNTVRQAMIETVFCLVGFSGDDPNFLEWSGWVRDQLREVAQKIYLVGWLNLVQQERVALQDLNVVPIDIASHPQAMNWPADLRHQYAIEWFLHALESGAQPYDQVAWPSPSTATSPDAPSYLLPVTQFKYEAPRDHPDPQTALGSPTYVDESVDRVRTVLDAWAHNREIYPGWLVFPYGGNHSELSRRTNDWEPHILGALPELRPVERLKAVREILWRKEILLEPMSPEVETAAQDALDAIDCELRSIEQSEESEEDWDEIRDAWRAVALALLTAARMDCNQRYFELLLESLSAFCDDSNEVAHRVHQERCLWALYSMDLESLLRLLDNWGIEDNDPIWMLRKAALLTEIRRFDESRPLVRKALDLIRSDSRGVDRISNASKEGWALGSTLSNNNSDSVFRRWDELSSARCHAWDEIGEIDRVLNRSARESRGPAYDLGIRRSTTIRWSNESYSKIVAAYRAIRLPEVTGLPPVNFPASSLPIGMSATSGILKAAAEELITVKPELAIKLALRVFTSERDEGLQMIVSRLHVATLQEDIVMKLAQTCISAIEFSLPHLIVPGELRVNEFSVARIRVAAEVLSRLVMRLPPEMLGAVLDLGLESYRAVPKHYWLERPVGSLLRRTWEALPRPERIERTFDLLAAPIAGLEDFKTEALSPDPGRFLSKEDLPSSRTTDNEMRLKEIFDLLMRGLSGDDIARGRATLRLIWMVNSGLLTKKELSAVAGALWGNSDPVLGNSSRSDSPLDWAYFVLPELEKGQAEKSFRQKWLTADQSDRDADLAYTANMIDQVGAAVSALRISDKSLAFSAEEIRHITTQVEHLADTFCSGTLSFNFNLSSQIRHLGLLVSEISIPDDLADSLYQKAELLLEAPSYPENSFYTNLSDIRTAIGFGLIPGLVKALPSRTETMMDWLRIGLASDENARVSSTVSALSTWVSASAHQKLPPIPAEFITGIGVIVASRRGVGLADALWCAVWIFDRGTPEHQNALGSLVLSGLRHLAGKLQYDYNQQDDDTPTLRLLCVQLAASMSRNGFADHATIRQWLDEGRKDPFPEVRRAAAKSEYEEDAAEDD